MLKEFIKSVSIYGISPIIGKFIGLFLIPVYTRVLIPAEFGALDIYMAFAHFASALIGLELYTGVGRHYYDSDKINNKQKLNVDYYPTLKEPEEVHFTIENVTPFDDEVFSLPDLALKANLRYYYGSNEAPSAFWGKQSHDRSEKFDDFTRENSKIKNIIKEFELLEYDSEKIVAAYQWIQDNIQKTNYADDEEFDENDNINDVIKHKYGDATDIDLLLYDMLREMNIDAKMVYVADRDESILEKKAKYWQFDRSIVLVRDREDKYTFYDPSPKYLLPGSVLWYNEGLDALIVESQSENFHNTPFSNYKQNHITRLLTLKMNSDLSCIGVVTDKEKGHPARSLRLDLDETTELDQRSQLKDYYEDVFPYGHIDSITIENINDPIEPLIINSKIEMPQIGQNAQDRIILKVSDLLGYQQNEFVTDERIYPIIFKYSHEVLDLVNLEIPENYEIEEIPSEQLISNQAGACQIQVKVLNRGRVVSINRLFRLAMPFFRPDDYPGVRYLFQMRDYFNDAAIILKKIPEKPKIKS